jgi:hypothetical protein
MRRRNVLSMALTWCYASPERAEQPVCVTGRSLFVMGADGGCFEEETGWRVMSLHRSSPVLEYRRHSFVSRRGVSVGFARLINWIQR